MITFVRRPAGAINLQSLVLAFDAATDDINAYLQDLNDVLEEGRTNLPGVPRGFHGTPEEWADILDRSERNDWD